MISRAHRFHGYNSLHPVYRQGKTLRGPFISLKFQRNERRRTYRVAVVVSRKVHKSAVVRNRIRRRVYEVVRTSEEQITGPFDIIITVFNAQVAELAPQKLNRLVQAQLAEAKIISPKQPPAEHAIVKPKGT